MSLYRFFLRFTSFSPSLDEKSAWPFNPSLNAFKAWKFKLKFHSQFHFCFSNSPKINLQPYLKLLLISIVSFTFSRLQILDVIEKILQNGLQRDTRTLFVQRVPHLEISQSTNFTKHYGFHKKKMNWLVTICKKIISVFLLWLCSSSVFYFCVAVFLFRPQEAGSFGLAALPR